jgi:hypothetical protein
MKFQTPNPRPLPSGFVTINKGRRPEILVGVLNGHRQLAQGFDVKGYAPNHFRTIEPGNFGLIIAARTAVEVRAILDGKLMFEGLLEPLTPPQPMMGLDPQRLKKLLESPQPHFIDHNVDGQPFMFQAPTPELDPRDVVMQQLHPGFDGPAVAAAIRRAPQDATPQPLAFDETLPAVQAPAPVLGSDQPAAASEHACGGDDDHECSCGHDHGEAESTEKTLVSTATAADTATSSLAQEDHGLDHSPEDGASPDNMAPSYGYLVVGVRIIDAPRSETSEPAGPPDAFSYVGFQLNPWRLHNLVLAQCINRMVVPAKEDLDDAARRQGFEHEIPAKGPVCACCNGSVHR